MTKCIDKDALVVEIEKMRDKAYPKSDWNRGYVTSCEEILSFLDTLEVEEMDLDNREDIKNAFKRYFPSEFSSYEDYVKYLKEKGFAVEVPQKEYTIKRDK